MLGYLLAQPGEFGALGGGERLIAGCCGGFDSPAFVGDPPTEEGLR
ncbi:hypothetical protein O4160_25400 [Rhodococcus sp. IEGM 1401]|nr:MULTISPECIES: hypothetical protein [unclassified Rhodococcus (in: high G+C Gram-positive bacteria)]MCZ4564183.1 hypothetical protein [Rhodococcus sp. IEGM 1401]MDI9924313.1 hypothetical protein [Rhodococcus sp. IEGM 1372]MDV8036741.1 hypothetical protein [Rhodococcus sp. IEGM 1414]